MARANPPPDREARRRLEIWADEYAENLAAQYPECRERIRKSLKWQMTRANRLPPHVLRRYIIGALTAKIPRPATDED